MTHSYERELGMDRPLLATLRFLASPILEGRLAHLTEDALRFVVEGKSQRRLTALTAASFG